MNILELEQTYEWVPLGCECPKCGEDSRDCIIYYVEDYVTCNSCGHDYWIDGDR